MTQKQNISIRLADVAPISLTIDRDDEGLMRRAEYNINQLFQLLQSKYESKTPKEVLAMVTFQFAKAYYQLQENLNDTFGLIEDFENELDRLLELTADNAIDVQASNSEI